MERNKVQEFKENLEELGYGKSSVGMLPECVGEFMEYYRDKEIGEIGREEIAGFYQWLQMRPNRRKEGGLSERYIYHHIYALKLFFEYMERSGQLGYNPISGMKFKRPEYGKREPLSREEIGRLFAAVESQREEAILHLFYSCGLRRSEGERLNIRDVCFRSGLLYVREGKGGKRRVVPMTEKVSESLKLYYIRERGERKAAEKEAFILNLKGERMSGNSYNLTVKRLGERAGIEREVTLHYLRHSIATHLLENGIGIEKVRDFLGHRNLEATQLYTKVSAQQLKGL
jgi:integrase/recombinase XerD